MISYLMKRKSEMWTKDGGKKAEMRGNNLCVMAHSLILRLISIFIFNLPSADYFISDIKHLIKK